MSPTPSDGFLDATRRLLRALLDASEDDPQRRRALEELAGWLQGELRGAQAETLGSSSVDALPAETPVAPKSNEGAYAGPREEPHEEPRVEARPLSIGGRTVLVAARVAEEGLDPRLSFSPEGRVILPPDPTKDRFPGRQRTGLRPGPRDEEDWPWVLERTRARSRLKADACAWARTDHGEPRLAEERRQELVARARELGHCYAWPLERSRPLPDDDLLLLCEEAYENLALVVDVILTTRRWITGAVAPPEDLLFLAAEVQSALRAVLLEADVQDDSDQIDVFIWVKELGYRHSIYVPRHLRREDPADPADWLARRERVDALGAKLRSETDDRRERKRLLDKLHYQVARLAKSTAERDQRTAWADVLRSLEAWVASQRPPTSREVTDPLLPHLDLLPEDLEVPAGAQRVLLAVDDLLAARSAAAAAAPPSPAPISPEVLEARRLLAGRVVVLIGGERRVDVEQRLCRELGLAELRWRSTRPHRSIDPLIEQITRPEVDLVIVAVRWSDHAFGELREVALAAGKPFVQLPAGYGTNQIAHHVLAQASGKLGGVARP